MAHKILTDEIRNELKNDGCHDDDAIKAFEIVEMAMEKMEISDEEFNKIREKAEHDKAESIKVEYYQVTVDWMTYVGVFAIHLRECREKFVDHCLEASDIGSLDLQYVKQKDGTITMRDRLYSELIRACNIAGNIRNSIFWYPLNNNTYGW